MTAPRHGPSLRRQLLRPLVWIWLLGMLVATAGAYLLARSSANMAFDRGLQDAAGEFEPAARAGIVEGLLSNPIPGDKHPLGISRCALIINREGEHTVETSDGVGAPSPVRRQDDLCVAAPAKALACPK